MDTPPSLLPSGNLEILPSGVLELYNMYTGQKLIPGTRVFSPIGSLRTAIKFNKNYLKDNAELGNITAEQAQEIEDFILRGIAPQDNQTHQIIVELSKKLDRAHIDRPLPPIF